MKKLLAVVTLAASAMPTAAEAEVPPPGSLVASDSAVIVAAEPLGGAAGSCAASMQMFLTDAGVAVEPYAGFFVVMEWGCPNVASFDAASLHLHVTKTRDGIPDYEPIALRCGITNTPICICDTYYIPIAIGDGIDFLAHLTATGARDTVVVGTPTRCSPHASNEQTIICSLRTGFSVGF